MSENQYKKLQFLKDTMAKYGVHERGFKVAAHAFRHLHMDILGRDFRCETCVVGRKEITELMSQKGRSYQAILDHRV